MSIVTKLPSFVHLLTQVASISFVCEIQATDILLKWLNDSPPTL